MKSMGRGRFLLSGKDLFAQIRQPVQSLVQRIVLFGKVETHQMVHRFLKATPHRKRSEIVPNVIE